MNFLQQQQELRKSNGSKTIQSFPSNNDLIFKRNFIQERKNLLLNSQNPFNLPWKKVKNVQRKSFFDILLKKVSEFFTSILSSKLFKRQEILQLNNPFQVYKCVKNDNLIKTMADSDHNQLKVNQQVSDESLLEKKMTQIEIKLDTIKEHLNEQIEDLKNENSEKKKKKKKSKPLKTESEPLFIDKQQQTDKIKYFRKNYHYPIYKMQKTDELYLSSNYESDESLKNIHHSVQPLDESRHSKKYDLNTLFKFNKQDQSFDFNSDTTDEDIRNSLLIDKKNKKMSDDHQDIYIKKSPLLMIKKSKKSSDFFENDFTQEKQLDKKQGKLELDQNQEQQPKDEQENKQLNQDQEKQLKIFIEQSPYVDSNGEKKEISPIQNEILTDNIFEGQIIKQFIRKNSQKENDKESQPKQSLFSKTSNLFEIKENPFQNLSSEKQVQLSDEKSDPENNISKQQTPPKIIQQSNPFLSKEVSQTVALQDLFKNKEENSLFKIENNNLFSTNTKQDQKSDLFECKNNSLFGNLNSNQSLIIQQQPQNSSLFSNLTPQVQSSLFQTQPDSLFGSITNQNNFMMQSQQGGLFSNFDQINNNNNNNLLYNSSNMNIMNNQSGGTIMNTSFQSNFQFENQNSFLNQGVSEAVNLFASSSGVSNGKQSKSKNTKMRMNDK